MNNEDGIKVDQFLLLTDRLYVPVAVEKINCEPQSQRKTGGPAGSGVGEAEGQPEGGT